MICARLIFSVLLCVVTLANSLANNKLNWRVVGGNDAAPGAYPFIISLRNRNYHNCGGSILGGVWVLTAAHCIYRIDSSVLKVVVGTNQLNAGGVTYSVKRTIIHQGYDMSTNLNDIALIELTTSIIENDLVKRIELDTEDTEDKPRAVTLIGWGFTRYPGSLSNNLQYLQLQTISIQRCTEFWPSTSITNKQLCTAAENGKGACQGDNGGPLINAAGRLTGIVSFGKPCARGIPDIYTKVAAYISWIHKETSN